LGDGGAGQPAAAGRFIVRQVRGRRENKSRLHAIPNNTTTTDCSRRGEAAKKMNREDAKSQRKAVPEFFRLTKTLPKKHNAAGFQCEWYPPMSAHSILDFCHGADYLPGNFLKHQSAQQLVLQRVAGCSCPVTFLKL